MSGGATPPSFIIFTLLLLLSSGPGGGLAAKKDDPISPHVVHTVNGPWKGVQKLSRNGTPYVSFMGVRYADPPKRFEPPEPLGETWTTPKVANKPVTCAQAGGFSETILEEDCLALNIHVPTKSLESRDKLPVMFWIHGGGFSFGDGHGYKADYFMDDGDVILISVNYRLGIFGFLSLEDDTVVGNNGLRDQVMALKWVQANIASFKGNPDRVTVFGNSAGAASIHFLLMSPLASGGLFRNAILQSGAFSLYSLAEPRRTAIKLAEHLNCSISSTNDQDQDEDEGVSSLLVRKCFEDKSVLELLTAQSSFYPRWPEPTSITRFPPTPKESSKNPFFPTHPGALFGRYNLKFPNPDVNVMIGMTQSEGSTVMATFVLSSEQNLQEINDNWEEVVPLTLCIDTLFPTDALPVVARKIRDFYFGKEKGVVVSLDTAEQLSNMYSDALFVVPGMVAADELARAGMPVYPYIYAYDSDWNIRRALSLVDPPGVGHGDELQYMFPHDLMSRPLEPNSEADEYSKTYVRFLKHFAKHGKPASEWKPGKKVSWPRIKPHHHPQQEQESQPPKSSFNFNLTFDILSIEKEPKLTRIDFSSRVRFWVELFRDYAIIPPGVEKNDDVKKSAGKTEL